MRLLKTYLFPSVLLIALSIPATAKRGVKAEDYFAFEFINDARISPDGKQVAYVFTFISLLRIARIMRLRFSVKRSGAED